MFQYPTEDDVEEIKKFSGHFDNREYTVELSELLAKLKEIWCPSDLVKINTDDNTLELHTGGWSGNEEILSYALQSSMFWVLCWEKSERGGHYYFNLNKLIREDD